MMAMLSSVEDGSRKKSLPQSLAGAWSAWVVGVFAVVGFHLALRFALCLGVFLLRFLLLSDHLLVSPGLAIGVDVSGGCGKAHAQPQQNKQDDQDSLHTVSTQPIAMILPQICRVAHQSVGPCPTG
jgi:hypothetical protein